MKRILLIVLCLIGLASTMMADEKEDSLVYYLELYSEAKQSDDYKEAYTNLGTVLRIYKSMNEDVSQDTVYATMLVYYAECCFNVKDDETAINIGTEVSDIYKAVYGANTLQYVQSISSLAMFYAEFSKYKEAIRLALEALEIQKIIIGEGHPSTAKSYYNIGSIYNSQGDYGKALEYYFKALEIYERINGTAHPSIATFYNNIGLVYKKQRDYSKALEYYFKALEIYEKVLGTDHSNTATSYNNIGCVYDDQQNYFKALEYYFKALEIYEKVLGTDHPSVASIYNNIGGACKKLGDYDKALEYHFKVLKIREKELGTGHPRTAASYNNIGGVYNNLRDYGKALEYHFKALDIFKKVNGAAPPYTATSYNNIGGIYYNLRDYGKALEYYLKALEIYERFYDADLTHIAPIYNNIGSVYNSQGDYDKALEYHFKALEIYEKVLGTDHSNTATSYNNIGCDYYDQQNYFKALEYYSKAQEIYEKVLGTDHPSVASIYSNIGSVYNSQGDNNKALEYNFKALEIRIRTLGIDHPDYAKSLGNLAYIYFILCDYTEAIRLLNVYAQIVRKNVLVSFSGLTANERQMYWNRNIDRLVLNEFAPRAFVKLKTYSASSLLYDNVALFSKGLLLSTELEMAKLIRESGDDEAKQMYSELRKNRQILNFQYSKPIAERYINCDSLERVSTELERKLGSRVQEFGDITKNLSITWKDVQSKLDDSDIAIEFLSYPENDSTVAYIALTLCKNDTAPLLTPLFTELQLKDVAGSDDTYQNAVSDSLIWDPLASRMEGKSRIYFSAAGMLHRIGIEYLPSMEGKHCYRLSSTRELVTHKPSEGIKSATLFGGIDYDATYASIKPSAPSTPSELSAPNEILYAENTASAPIIYKQGGRGGLDEYNSMRTMRYSVDSLPGSRKEIQAISALLKEPKFNVQDCDTITRNLASEESFKALSGQRRSLIHISTHGFYYDTIKAKNMGEHLRMMLMGDDRPSRSEDKSLLRCGLCFAGANQFLREMRNPAEGQDEGILNALEIAQTDLRGLDLVVLSACQTALGDVVNGEGVFGLQRGFKKAGARSILMSLWKVDDEITTLLMTEFYKAWTSGMTKAAALKAAQDVVKEKYPNPNAWAGFILLDALD